MGLKKKSDIPKLSSAEAEEILQKVFLNCYEDSNNIPVEQLEMYANYRSERLGLQKAFAIIGLYAFIILPLWFIAPRITVSDPVMGERDLPVYTINVGGILPIKSVVAVRGGRSLPVYQQGRRTFTVEPTSNGQVDITVELFSGQWVKSSVEVSGLTGKPPELLGNSMDGDNLYIYVSDEDGVAFGDVKAVDSDGNVIYPSDYDVTEGYVEFDDLEKSVVVYIPDRLGYTLNVTVNKEKTK